MYLNGKMDERVNFEYCVLLSGVPKQTIRQRYLNKTDILRDPVSILRFSVMHVLNKVLIIIIIILIIIIIIIIN